LEIATGFFECQHREPWSEKSDWNRELVERIARHRVQSNTHNPFRFIRTTNLHLHHDRMLNSIPHEAGEEVMKPMEK
jgi:hypothetical protein